jgi:hypothetical protein
MNLREVRSIEHGAESMEQGKVERSFHTTKTDRPHDKKVAINRIAGNGNSHIFTPTHNVIPGSTPLLRIERFLIDHPSHATQPTRLSRNGVLLRLSRICTCYDVDSTEICRALILREERKKEKETALSTATGP